MKVHEEWPGFPFVDQMRVSTFKQIVGSLREGSDTLLDLGAGPCVFARHARDAGFRVTAVDARTERLPDEMAMHDITFVESDVRDFDVSGFDVISNLGLLYHLTLDDQKDLLRRSSYTTVVLETQVHSPSIVPPDARPWGYNIVTDGDYEGVLFPEGNNPMASIGNRTSFWHTEPSLLRLIENCGFIGVTTVEPFFVSKYGARKFYILEGDARTFPVSIGQQRRTESLKRMLRRLR